MQADEAVDVVVRDVVGSGRRKGWPRVLSGLVLAAVLLGAFSLRLWVSADAVLRVVPDHPVMAAGFLAGAYAFFVMAMLPTLPLNLAAGLLFGALGGGALATGGGALGCVLSFLIARHLMAGRWERRVGHDRFANFRKVVERRGWLFVAFVRLNPILPTGPINYIFGLTDVRLWTYTWTTFAFLLPPAIGFAALGKAAGGIYLTGEVRADLHLIYLASAGLTLLSALVAGGFWLRGRLTAEGGRTVTAPRELSLESPTIERLSSTEPKVTLLVLTLNEIEGMRQIMPQISPDWCDQIIVVDGGSTDGTIEWAREQGYEVHVQSRRGIRFAYFEVFPKVAGDIIISFSPDGNCPVSAIPDLIAKMCDGYDMVIASRYLAGAHSDDDDILTAFGNWLFTRTVNLLHGGGYTDVMVILRAFRKSLVTELALLDDAAYDLPEKLFGTVISWEPLMSVRAAKRRLRVTEIPADEPARIGGERKLQMWRWGAAYYFQFWRELWFWREQRATQSAHATLAEELPLRRTE